MHREWLGKLLERLYHFK